MNNKIDQLYSKIRQTKDAFQKVKMIEDLEKEIKDFKKSLITTYLKEMK
ncbi:hypothetical protein N9T92_01390 [Candidatus Pelagibacter sp.]|jgi:peptidoglycan hydrolase CwlO-like protein|nr:hypothetical protein [Candidatus Pelagibacter sp.]|tara:strand:- start:316 stop:462 length:147 start_codon:yes stop_codon:yes gene_type:complete